MAEKKKLKKPGWIEEFKAFAIKGNALSMAVGVIIGGGFSTITKSLTDDVIMPIVSMFLGGVNFSQWYITLPQWFGQKLDEGGNPVANTLNYGSFLSAVINFLILALVVFWLVKFLNKLMEMGHKKKEEAPAPPPEPSNEEKAPGGDPGSSGRTSNQKTPVAKVVKAPPLLQQAHFSLKVLLPGL